MDNNYEKGSENTQRDNSEGDYLPRWYLPSWVPLWLFKAIGPIALLILIVAGGSGYFAYYYVNKDSVRMHEWVAFVLAFMGLVIVCVQIVIYAQQAEFMKRQIKATERDTTYSQRAYVYTKIGSVSEDIFDIVLLIENSGNSPANNLRISYKACFRDTDPYKDCGDWDSFRDPRFKPRRIGVLPPKIHFPETIYNRPIPKPEQLRKYYNRGWNYHCWGELFYDDVFGNEWYTSFAFYVTAIGNIKITILPGLSGNEMT